MRDLESDTLRAWSKAIAPDVPDSLAALLRSTDAVDLERLLIRLHTPILRYLIARLPSDQQEAARDLTVETLVRAATFRTSCHATEDAQVVAWALRIAERFRIEHFRQVYLERAALADIAGTSERTTPPNTGEGAAAQTLLSILEPLHDELPSTTQRVLWLRLVDGATWQEAASTLRTTPSGAKRRYQRAIARLRRGLLRRISDLPVNEREAACSMLKGVPGLP